MKARKTQCATFVTPRPGCSSFSVFIFTASIYFNTVSFTPCTSGCIASQHYFSSIFVCTSPANHFIHSSARFIVGAWWACEYLLNLLTLLGLYGPGARTCEKLRAPRVLHCCGTHSWGGRWNQSAVLIDLIDWPDWSMIAHTGCVCNTHCHHRHCESSDGWWGFWKKTGGLTREAAEPRVIPVATVSGRVALHTAGSLRTWPSYCTGFV